MDLLNIISTTWRQYRAFWTELTRLQRLSESDLARLGITRGDLTRVAFERAERDAEEPARPVVTRQGAGSRGLAASAG